MGGGYSFGQQTARQEPWYKWGQAILLIQLGLAILQTVYSLYMALTGAGGLGGGH